MLQHVQMFLPITLQVKKVKTYNLIGEKISLSAQNLSIYQGVNLVIVVSLPISLLPTAKGFPFFFSLSLKNPMDHHSHDYKA